MQLHTLFDRDGCPELASCPAVACPGTCNLKTQSCSIVAQSCPSTCATIRCDPLPNVSSGGSGPTPGALAGAVIGALTVLAFVVLGYMYYRRREAAKEAAREKAIDVKPDIPARADAVLSRPDPHFSVRAPSGSGSEKATPNPDATELGTVRVYNAQSDTTINLDPSRAASPHSNPFADGASIQTASDRTQSTNVIPIALVPPGGHLSDPLSGAGTSSRPIESSAFTLTEANHMDLEHVTVSDSDSRLPYASSTRSAVSAMSSMTSSTAADLDETTTIMTPKEGVVRQVFGVSQAQVVRVPSSAGTSQAGGSNSFSSLAKPRGARGNTKGAAVRLSKATIGRSPLAQQSFTPADIPLANREPSSPTSMGGSRANPFSDPVSHRPSSIADSSRSTDTFGTPTDYSTEGPFTPRPGATFADASRSRPASIASTADGVSIRADIGTASRVILGMQTSSTYTASAISHHQNSRATSMQTSGGRTVITVDRDDDEESVRRHSVFSAKTTSSRADSVLAGFPFVPPSPISALPPRSPGATSPNLSPSSGGSTFARQQALNKSTGSSPPHEPTPVTNATSLPRQGPQLPPVPPIPRPDHSRQVTERAPSTFSTSTASGLETYPFQFGSQPVGASNTQLRQSSRASLDTLALSRDVAAFPLEGTN